MHVRPTRGLLTFSTAAASSDDNGGDFRHYFSLLDRCTSARHLRRLHGHLLRAGLLSDVILGSKLLLQYSRHGELLSSAYPFFLQMPHRNSFSFSIIIGELSRSGDPLLAAHLFSRMRRAGLPLDSPTAAVALRCHAALPGGAAGPVVHALSIKLGLHRSPFVASAGVFLYSSMGRIPQARAMFEETHPLARDAALLTAYAQAALPAAALELFSQMAELDGVAMVAVLSSCTRLGALLQGKNAHCFILRRGVPFGLSLGNAVIDMYAKCGELRYAERVFGRMPRKDVISWSALILGHGLSGGAARAMELFREMKEGRVGPNGVTYLGALSACTHAGWVSEAWALWGEMEKAGVEKEVKHYACMVDVLGRAGRVEEAEELAEKMEVEPDAAVWAALLAACRSYGEMERAERAARRLLLLRPEGSGYYALMANVFSDAGRYEDAEKVRMMMKEMNVGKLPGWSSTGFLTKT
ncbi:pentatricopeptide repeat-containing protein At4g14170-like [Wolffia australiana]